MYFCWPGRISCSARGEGAGSARIVLSEWADQLSLGIDNCGTSGPLKCTFHSIHHNRPQNPVRDQSLWLFKFMSFDLPCATALLPPLDIVCLDIYYSGTCALCSLMLFKLNWFFFCWKVYLGLNRLWTGCSISILAVPSLQFSNSSITFPFLSPSTASQAWQVLSVCAMMLQHQSSHRDKRNL